VPLASRRDRLMNVSTGSLLWARILTRSPSAVVERTCRLAAVLFLRSYEMRHLRGRIHHVVFGARDQGRCDNHLTIRRDEVEARVLRALRDKLLRQDLFEEFCDEFTREMNRLRMEHRASLSAAEREIERIEARRNKHPEMAGLSSAPEIRSGDARTDRRARGWGGSAARRPTGERGPAHCFSSRVFRVVRSFSTCSASSLNSCSETPDNRSNAKVTVLPVPLGMTRIGL
jgi:hypothetical protein